MAASAAHSSMGYVLKVKNVSFLEVIEVRNLSGPTRTWDLDDITTLGSPDKAEELLPTVKRMGVVTWTMNHLPADTQHQYVENANDNATKEEWQITASDAGAELVQFFGYVTKFERNAEVGRASIVNVEVKLTGDYTVTP